MSQFGATPEKLASASRARLIMRLKAVVAMAQEPSELNKSNQTQRFFARMVGELLVEESRKPFQRSTVPDLFASQPCTYLAAKLEEEGFDFVGRDPRETVTNWLLKMVREYESVPAYLRVTLSQLRGLFDEIARASGQSAQAVFERIGKTIFEAAQQPVHWSTARTEIERARRVSKEPVYVLATKELIVLLADLLPAECLNRDWLKASVGNYFFTQRESNPSAFLKAKAFGVQFPDEFGLNEKREARHGKRGFRDTERFSPPPDLTRFAVKSSPQIIQGDFHANRQKTVDEKPARTDGPSA